MFLPVLSRLPIRGTLLNALFVAIGAMIGLSLGRLMPASLQGNVIPIIGLCVILFAAKLFFKGDNLLITIGSVVLGGIVGSLLKIDVGLDQFAEWARVSVGGTGRFNEGLITTSVLYCVGPMTLLGCLNDGLSGDIELLKIKSMLDGIGAIFFAAAFGPAVLVTAVVVLVVQGVLTLAARAFQPLSKIPATLNEMSAVGGVMLLAIGLGLTGIKKLPVAVLLPALFIAPLVVLIQQRFQTQSSANKVPSPESN